MKDQKGITLISLVITIIIMGIITSVVTYSGLESMGNTKKIAFISELEMIQAKVNTIYEKRKTSIEEVNYYNNLGSDINTLNESVISEPLGGTSKEGFRYFSKNSLKQLGLENINQDVIINFNTREVISLTGFKIDDRMCYKLSDIPEYSYNIQYIKEPTFTVEQEKLGTSEYKFTIKNIDYDSSLGNIAISYKLHSATEWTSNGESTSFTINTPRIIRHKSCRW